MTRSLEQVPFSLVGWSGRDKLLARYQPKVHALNDCLVVCAGEQRNSLWGEDITSTAVPADPLHIVMLLRQRLHLCS
jgi:hypothetical protein